MQRTVVTSNELMSEKWEEYRMSAWRAETKVRIVRNIWLVNTKVLANRLILTHSGTLLNTPALIHWYRVRFQEGA